MKPVQAEVTWLDAKNSSRYANLETQCQAAFAKQVSVYYRILDWIDYKFQNV